MKVVQINCVYGWGSTGTLVRDLHHALMESGDESLALYGRRETAPEPGVERTGGEFPAKCNALLSRITGLMYGGCLAETERILNRLRAEKPDVVHLHCINGNFVNIYRLVSFLKEEKIPTVLTLHAEFLYTANCSHAYDCEKWTTGCGSCPDPRGRSHSWMFDRTALSWAKMRDAFADFERLSVVAVSPWQELRARRSPFFTGARFRTILNGVDTAVFRPAGERTPRQIRQILYVTPHYDPRPGHVKGGEYLYPLAERLGDRARILCVGEGDWGTAPKNVEILGPVWDRGKMASLYADADVTLLTSRRETFSMVTAESLCCGTPVVGFRAGGPESIALPAYSRFCDPGDLGQLAKALLLVCPADPQTIAKEAAERYGKERTIHAYLDEYKKVRTHTCD